MEQALIDTNIISKYLDGSLPVEGQKHVLAVLQNGANLSFVNLIELWSWKTSPQIEKSAQLFVDSCHIYFGDIEIARLSAQLRIKHKLKTPDAIIAATAIRHKLTILTDNEKDFAHIKRLKVLNPAAL
jgi:predicted nucleic acid-binding protein